MRTHLYEEDLPTNRNWKNLGEEISLQMLSDNILLMGVADLGFCYHVWCLHIAINTKQVGLLAQENQVYFKYSWWNSKGLWGWNQGLILMFVASMITKFSFLHNG